MSELIQKPPEAAPVEEPGQETDETSSSAPFKTFPVNTNPPKLNRQLNPQSILTLQRTIGNRAVQRLIKQTLQRHAGHEEQEVQRLMTKTAMSRLPFLWKLLRYSKVMIGQKAIFARNSDTCTIVILNSEGWKREHYLRAKNIGFALHRNSYAGAHRRRWNGYPSCRKPLAHGLYEAPGQNASNRSWATADGGHCILDGRG